jgi:hypothetical protein
MNLIARTGQIDVNSNEGESRLVHEAVGATEDALHKSHVRVDKRVSVRRTRLGIVLRHHAADVCQANEAIHIGYRDWFRIDRIEGCWAKHVKSTAERWRANRNWNRSK